MTEPERSRVLFALVAVQVLFAIHYPVTKVLLGTIPPQAWAAYRLCTAAVLMAILRFRLDPRPLPLVDHARLAGFALFGVVLNQICFIEGMARTTPTHSALINTTIPVLTLTFAVLLGRERLRGTSALGVLFAMAGVLVLLQVDHLQFRGEWFAGDLLTQVNAASFSFFLVISRRTVQRIGAVRSTAVLLGWGAVGLAFWGGPAALAVPLGTWTPKLIALGAYAIVFPTVVAYFLNNWALARVDSSQVALFVYLQPILAAALSVTLLGEVLTPRLGVASALVFAGVLFATRRTKPTPAIAAAK